MKTVKLSTIKKQIKDGQVECMTDLKIGYVFIRWTKTGEREYVEVVKPYTKDQAMKDMGLVKVRGALGGIYYE